jgi:hypothetical protein
LGHLLQEENIGTLVTGGNIGTFVTGGKHWNNLQEEDVGTFVTGGKHWDICYRRKKLEQYKKNQTTQHRLNSQSLTGGIKLAVALGCRTDRQAT